MFNLTKNPLFIIVLLISLTFPHAFAENIVPVTECGSFGEPNTLYVLQNDLIGDFSCISLSSQLGGYIIDLNGYTVSSNRTSISGNCNNLKIINGRISGGNPSIELQEGSFCHLNDLLIETYGTGITAQFLSSSLFENITIRNSNNAFQFDDSVNSIVMKNIELTTENEGSVAFQINSLNSEFFLENSRFSGFTKNFLFGNTRNIVFHTMNNEIDYRSIDDNSQIGDKIRIFYGRPLKISVVNQTGQGIFSSVEVSDNGFLKSGSAYDNIHTIGLNPTGNIKLGTNENGIVETKLNERLLTVTKQAELTFDEKILDPYTVSVGVGSTTEAKTVSLDDTNTLNFVLNLPVSQKEVLPLCTVNRMLDLNNDGKVNLRDGAIIIAKFSGRDVKVSGTKECNALNFFPINGIS